MTTQIAEYNATAAALADLRERFKGVVYDVTTPKGMKDAVKGRRELRTLRVDLEKMRKEIKAPALERSRLIDAEAKTITAQIVELEEPIDGQIKAEEARKAAEKAEAERIERERVEAIRQKIEAIRSIPHGLIGRPVAEIESATHSAMIMDLSAFTGIDLDAASAAQVEAIDRLEAMADQAREDAAEKKRIADERAELAVLREAEEKRAAEAKAKADAEREAADRVAAVERKRLADEQAAADAKARAEREEEDRKAAAERRKLADEQAAVAARIAADREELDRAAREKAEAEAAKVRKEQADEAARLKAERDALEKAAREQAAAERQRVIETATLTSAAGDAVALLRDLGEGENVVTLALDAALTREASR